MLVRILKVAIPVGVVVALFNFLFFTYVAASFGPPPANLRADTPQVWYIVADFVVALVLVWVYERVRGSFAAGAKGGATFGLYVGVLVNFPTWIIVYMFLQGFSYGNAWVGTIAGIVRTVAAGAVAGALYVRMGGAKAS